MPHGVRCKEDTEATKATQEIVIRIFSNACAAAALACRDQIIKSYPYHCEEIMATKLRQIDDDDSSKESNAAVDADEAISENLLKEPGPSEPTNSEETTQVLRQILK